MSDRPEGSSRASRWTGEDIRVDDSDKYSDAGISDSGASSLPSPDFTPVDGEFPRRPGDAMSGVQAIGEGDDNSTSSGWESEDLPPSRADMPAPLDNTSQARPARTPQLALPSLVIGSQLGTGLSAIEQADAEVERWELIYQEILMVQGAAAVVSIGESLEKAREARRKLDLVEDRDAVEGTFTETEYFRKHAVDDRVQLLRSMLEDAEEENTIANMEGAIRAYEDGTVGVSEQYALFWAGHFMELASSYEEFTRDRYERTAAYASVHGPGSLWFEPPLIPSPPTVRVGRHGWPMAMRGTASGVGSDSHHWVTMSFQAVRYHQEPDYPGRLPGPSGARAHDASLAKARRFKGRGTTVKTHIPKSRTETDTTSDGGILVSDPDKPRLCFSMMFDTGATHPCLYETDLEALGIRFEEYPATSTTMTQTANGSMKCNVYELHVAMCDTQTGSSLVDSGDPVWPSRPHILGGITQVMALRGNRKVRPRHVGELDQNGEVKEFLYDAWKESLSSCMGRLSGLFPIQCCYVQSTPGLRAVWFGEDRRDVLGTQRMPGQRRFEPGNDICPPDPKGPELPVATMMDRHGEQADPVRLQMEHVVVNKAGIRQFRIRDIETKKRGRSELYIDDFVTREQTKIIEPRKKKRRRSSVTRSSSDDEYDDDDDATRKRRLQARRILDKLQNESLFFPPPRPPSAGTAA